MITSLAEKIIAWSVAITAKFGYFGIFVSMTLESAAIPIPSEVVLPFAGFLAATDKLNLWWTVFLTTFANLTGSIIIYYVGYFGGRPLLQKYGKYLLIHKDDLAKMDHWMQSHGARVAFLARLIPGVRTFSSLIIGAAKVNFTKFYIYTFLGSLLWNFPLIYIGFVSGNNWNRFLPLFRRFDKLILLLVFLFVVIFIASHIKKYRKSGTHD